MHVDYEVSEKDFLQAQKLAMKHSPIRSMRWMRRGYPLAGLILLVFLGIAIVREGGFKTNMIWGALFAWWLISIPLIIRRAQRKAYAKATHFHGPMSLDFDDYGMTIKGSGVDSRIAWSNFANFYEDDSSFVIYSSSSVFHPIPKRTLSAAQIAALRECLAQNIRAKG